jgi:hypothetical protein
MKLSAVLASACVLVARSSTLRGRSSDHGTLGLVSSLKDVDVTETAEPSEGSLRLFSDLEVAKDIETAEPPAGAEAPGLEDIILKIDADPKSLSGVAGIMGPMVKQLLGQVLAAHKASEAAIKTSVEAIGTCKVKPATTAGAPDVSKQYEAAKKSLTECKAAAGPMKLEIAGCSKNVAIMKTTADATCKKMKVKPIYDCAAKAPYDSTGTWLAYMATMWKQKLDEYQKVQWECGNVTKKITDQKTKCEKTASTLKSKSSQCGKAEASLGKAVCALKQGLSLGCGDYVSCYKRTVISYDNLKKQTDVEVKTRQGQYRMLKRLECLVGAYDFKTGKVVKSKLEKCGSAAQYNVDHLKMTYPATPAQKTCKTSSAMPAGVDPKMLQACA